MKALLMFTMACIFFSLFITQSKALPGYYYDLNVTVTNPDSITHTMEIAKINLTGLTLLTNNCTKELIGYNSIGLMDYFLYNADENAVYGTQWCDIEFMVPSITASQKINYTFYYGNSSANEKEHIVNWVYDDFSRNNIYLKLWNNTFSQQGITFIPCWGNATTNTADCNKNVSNSSFMEQGLMNLNYTGTQFTEASTFNISVSVLIDGIDLNVDCGPLFTGASKKFYDRDMFTMDPGDNDKWRWYSYKLGGNVQAIPKVWNMNQYYNHTFDYRPTGKVDWYVDDVLGISGTYASDDFSYLGFGSWRCPIKIDEIVVNANHYFDKQITEEFILTYNYTVPLITHFIYPTGINGSEAENKTYIIWNMSVSPPPIYGLFQINETNYSATCISDYCYFNETGFSINQTRCAFGWAFGNVTEEYICRDLIFMSIITIPIINYTETNVIIQLTPDTDAPITNMSCINDITLKIERSRFHTLSIMNGSIYGYYDNSTEERYCSNGCYDNLNPLGSDCAPTEFMIYIYGFISILLFVGFIGFVFKVKRRRR